MSDSLIWIDFNTLEKFMVDVFIGLGVPPEDARICSGVLIESDKRGIDSHGINRLKPIYYDRIREGIQEPVTNFEIVRETPTTAVIDGHNGMGHVIGTRAMQMAIKKAQRYGMGMTVVRNSTHYGIAGYYTSMACDAQMIGITGTNARPSIAPTFGTENMLGTNPLVFGIPTDEPFPFCIDCATSITQRGKIEIYARAGKPLPEGWVVRPDGTSGLDSKLALKELIDGVAALTPLGGIGEEMGGYKGYGYATVVEILSAALAGGSFLKMLSGFDSDGKKIPYSLGHFFIAIDISNFIEPVLFKKTTGDILRALRGSELAPGAERIYTAGEKEYEAWLERKDKGAPLDKSLQKEIRTMEKELGIKGYNFPF
ncbi:MAG: Ldh family oxidoreductase [Leptospirales bacterium]|nr:Ldh family oxidoreductase [Leptospirales bacterium]